MTDEINNKIEQTGEQDTKATEETSGKPKSIVEVAQELRDEIRQEKEALIKEREALEKASAEALLSGTSGGRVEAKPKEVDPIEYSQKALAGEIEDNGE